jgi:hypothetical protein
MIAWMTKAAAAAVLLFGLATPLARADECEAMIKSVKSLVDKHDPGKAGSAAQKCTAFGEGLGLLKSHRIVNDECLEDGEERTQLLATLDRSIRQIQSEVDKNCE